jgi:transposase
MEHFAGIDVSLEQSRVCVVDAAGKIIREAKVASEPGALVVFFREFGIEVSRIGLEAGPLSQWLRAGLVAAGFDVVLLETRHVKAALSAMLATTDRKSLPRRGPGMRAGLRSCCEWAGSGRCMRSRPAPRRSGPCWWRASCCKPSCWTSSSASAASCAGSG